MISCMGKRCHTRGKGSLGGEMNLEGNFLGNCVQPRSRGKN